MEDWYRDAMEKMPDWYRFFNTHRMRQAIIADNPNIHPKEAMEAAQQFAKEKAIEFREFSRQVVTFRDDEP